MLISTNAVTLILTLLIPVAVATVTKLHLADRWKSVVTIVLSGLVTLITSARTDGGAAVISAQMAFDWTITTAIAITSYVGLWKPVADVNRRFAPGVGIG
jgi:hypothetical protein